MFDPGAATSIARSPTLEKYDAFVRNVFLMRANDETVMTPGSSVGRSLQPALIRRATERLSLGLEESKVLRSRSVEALPAAATWVTPFLVDQRTARLTAAIAAAWSGRSSHQYMNGST